MKTFCCFFFLLCISELQAGSIVALLKSIENNHTLHMKYKQKAFVCKPYGIESVSELVQRTDVNSSCMQYLKEFRRADPKEKFFAALSLHVEQQYSVEGMEDSCLLHLSSGYSYSEALLENGYARIEPGQRYEDPLLRYRFKQAVESAKKNKSGIWSDVNVRHCFLMQEEEKK